MYYRHYKSVKNTLSYTMKEFHPYSPEELTARYFGFPEGLTYVAFMCLPEVLRRHIAEKNRILQTDAYNRTMEHIYGDEWDTPATYTLQFRRSPHGYIIVCGLRRVLEEFAALPITQSELDMAAAFYEEHASVPYFNKEKWQSIIDDYNGYLPIRIDCVPEGTAVLPGDPVLRVTGPSEIVSHFEPYIHRAYYESMVATTAHEIGREFPGRFIEVGKRGTPTEQMHLLATRAMLAGGGIRYSSSDSAAATLESLKDVGTLGHRYIQSVSIQEGMTEEDAFRKAILATDTVSLLVDLVDSYRGIQIALSLKESYRHTGKKIWIRLDSGNIAEQTLFTLREFARRGFLDPSMDKIIVEGIHTIDDMREIDELVRAAGFNPENHVIYGAGGLLVAKGTTRSDASSGFKLSKWGAHNTMKFSDSPGKENQPGEPTVFDTPDGRRIGQVGEDIGADIFIPAYRYPGVILIDDNPVTTYRRAQDTYGTISYQVAQGEKTRYSQVTEDFVNEIHGHYHTYSTQESRIPA